MMTSQAVRLIRLVGMSNGPATGGISVRLRFVSPPKDAKSANAPNLIYAGSTLGSSPLEAQDISAFTDALRLLAVNARAGGASDVPKRLTDRERSTEEFAEFGNGFRQSDTVGSTFRKSAAETRRHHRVEHDEDTAVAGTAYQPSMSLFRRSRVNISSYARAPNAFRRARCRIVGRGQGTRSKTISRRLGPGTSTPGCSSHPCQANMLLPRHEIYRSRLAG